MAPRLKAALSRTGRGSSTGFKSAIVLAGTNDVRVAAYTGGDIAISSPPLR